jgi:hypothetical protein
MVRDRTGGAIDASVRAVILPAPARAPSRPAWVRGKRDTRPAVPHGRADARRGVTLAVSCDCIVAADAASLANPEILMDVIPAMHFVHLLRDAFMRANDFEYRRARQHEKRPPRG